MFIDPLSRPPLKFSSPISQIPDEMLRSILFLLPLPDFFKCTQVCRQWMKLTADMSASFYSPRIQEDFTSSVIKQILTWKQVYIYTRLSSFMDEIMQFHYSDDTFIRQENPELKQESYPICILPNPFIRYGRYSFSISNSIDIKVLQDGKEPVILPGQPKKMVAYLAVDGPHLFALRRDGTIIQWDYQKAKRVNLFNTSYEKEHVVRHVGTDFCSRNGFHVKNGLIYLFYDCSNILEIISLDSNKHAYIDTSYHFRRIQIEKKRLILLSRNHLEIIHLNCATPNCVPLKFSSHELYLKMNISHFIIDFAVNGDVIYAWDTARDLHILDLNSQKEMKVRIDDWKSVTHIQVIDNLLFGFNGGGRSSHEIFVIDLNLKQQIASVNCSIDSCHLNEEVFHKLIEITKSHRKPFAPKIKPKPCVIA